MPTRTRQFDANFVAARDRDGPLCLIVHDDLDLRLRLAGLVRRAAPGVDSDTVTRAGFEALPQERLGAYAAVLLIVEFSLPLGEDPLVQLERLRRYHTRLPVFVFARGGDERAAARSMKAGATDYWPIHAVNIPELSSALAPLSHPVRDPPRLNLVDGRRKPEIAGYRLVKLIAHSKAASVYLARNDEFDGPVALKVQPIRRLHELPEGHRRRFVTECELLATLNHRAVANILDYGVTEEHLYLALEYFPCGSLRERLRNPVSEADAVNYARQIGEALHVVHAAHIVHRDLKPSNVMLTDDNRIVLIDFGSACGRIAAGGNAAADMSTGTPYYVCPEQVDGREPDTRGDLYSLGVVLFEMLAGALPFGGANLGQVFEAHRSAPVPRLPPAVAHHQPVVERLLAKDPNDRFASANLFIEGLDAAAAMNPRRTVDP